MGSGGCCRAETQKTNVTSSISDVVKTDDKIRDEVTEYYGKIVKRKDDLLTNACTTGANMPKYVRPIVAKVHDEVMCFDLAKCIRR